MKRVLVATDFSKEAENSVQYALNAAKDGGGEVILFHLHTISIHAVNARLPAHMLQDTIDANKGKLIATAEELTKEYGVNVKVIWTTGDFYEEIESVIDKYAIDLVVMGMADKSFEQDLLGNTTTAAISKIQVPILAVPLNVSYRKIRKFLFACDVNKGVSVETIERMKNVVSSFQAELEVFYVKQSSHSEDKEVMMEDILKENLSDLKYSYKVVDLNTSVIQHIQEELVAYDADVLIMIPYKYGFWNSILHKSKTRAMASGGQLPLLTLPFIAGN